MTPTLNIHALRTGTRARDLALLDLLHLQQLGLAPGAAPVRLLRQLWGLSQSQVSRQARRLDQRTRAQRWESVRRQLREVIG